jgi:hypothetical protein
VDVRQAALPGVWNAEDVAAERPTKKAFQTKLVLKIWKKVLAVHRADDVVQIVEEILQGERVLGFPARLFEA